MPKKLGVDQQEAGFRMPCFPKTKTHNLVTFLQNCDFSVFYMILYIKYIQNIICLQYQD